MVVSGGRCGMRLRGVAKHGKHKCYWSNFRRNSSPSIFYLYVCIKSHASHVVSLSPVRQEAFADARSAHAVTYVMRMSQWSHGKPGDVRMNVIQILTSVTDVVAGPQGWRSNKI